MREGNASLDKEEKKEKAMLHVLSSKYPSLFKVGKVGNVHVVFCVPFSKCGGVLCVANATSVTSEDSIYSSYSYLPTRKEKKCVLCKKDTLLNAPATMGCRRNADVILSLLFSGWWDEDSHQGSLLDCDWALAGRRSRRIIRRCARGREMILLGIDKKGKGGREGARPLIAARGCDVACFVADGWLGEEGF